MGQISLLVSRPDSPSVSEGLRTGPDSAGARTRPRPIWPPLLAERARGTPPIVLTPESRFLARPRGSGGIGPAAIFFRLLSSCVDASMLTHPHRPFVGVTFPRRRGGYRSWRHNFPSQLERIWPTPIVLSSESRSSPATGGIGPAAIFFRLLSSCVDASMLTHPHRPFTGVPFLGRCWGV
jgi:hypothetical protein